MTSKDFYKALKKSLFISRKSLENQGAESLQSSAINESHTYTQGTSRTQSLADFLESFLACWTQIWVVVVQLSFPFWQGKMTAGSELINFRSPSGSFYQENHHNFGKFLFHFSKIRVLFTIKERRTWFFHNQMGFWFYDGDTYTGSSTKLMICILWPFSIPARMHTVAKLHFWSKN